MSKHNYSQYSKNTNQTEPAVAQMIDEIEEVTTPEETHVIPEVVTEPAVPEPKHIEGTVVGCTKLNVRTYPSTNSDVVCVINANDVVIIDPDKSNKDWFKVVTNDGSVGYCMRKFVNANL